MDAGFEHFSGERVCIFSDTDATCHYGSVIGWLTIPYLFLSCYSGYYVKEHRHEDGRTSMLFDAGASAAWTLLWFATFLALAVSKTDTYTDIYGEKRNFSDHAINNANASIAFSLFTAICFVSNSQGSQSTRKARDRIASMQKTNSEIEISRYNNPG